jgi:hypothetical protein
VAVTRGHIATGFFEGKAATVCRKHIKDFVERIGLVAQSARTGGEGAAARLAAIQPDRFEFLGATAFRGDPPAVAGRAALGRLMGDWGFAVGRSVARGMKVYSTARLCGHEFARPLARREATNWQGERPPRGGRGYAKCGAKICAVARSWPVLSRAVVTGMERRVRAHPDSVFLFQRVSTIVVFIDGLQRVRPWSALLC